MIVRPCIQLAKIIASDEEGTEIEPDEQILPIDDKPELPDEDTTTVTAGDDESDVQDEEPPTAEVAPPAGDVVDEIINTDDVQLVNSVGVPELELDALSMQLLLQRAVAVGNG